MDEIPTTQIQWENSRSAALPLKDGESLYPVNTKDSAIVGIALLKIRLRSSANEILPKHARVIDTVAALQDDGTHHLHGYEEMQRETRHIRQKRDITSRRRPRKRFESMILLFSKLCRWR